MCDSSLDMMKRKYMSVKKVHPDISMDNVLICDAEYDDNICYQILEKIHKTRGTKLNVIVQLPPSIIIMKYNKKSLII
tara:strand:- start:458 stop:691 length:234 start_codon:yes stop_codon:yes gene_type:complete